jgi:uncharacterized hydrophobic protein (TIGR00271 family)
MSRSIQVSVPSDKTDRIVEKLRGMRGVVSLSLQKGASLKPRGDVLVVQATNEAFAPIQAWLADYVGDSGTVMSSEPRSLVSPTSQQQIEQETNEGSWPEMAALLRRETNPSSNYLMAMFFAGLVASAGLWSDQLHIVIAAMVIAPGFEPIIRVPFGVLAQEQRSWRMGLKSTLVGYVALILGAAVAVLVAMVISDATEGTLGSRQLVQYWSSLSPMSVIIALAAAAAGAAIIAAQRSVLTAGVMIALALIPSASIIGMAVVSGELSLAAQALLRWLVDVACVVAGGTVVFGAKKLVKRRADRSPKGDIGLTPG